TRTCPAAAAYASARAARFSRRSRPTAAASPACSAAPTAAPCSSWPPSGAAPTTCSTTPAPAGSSSPRLPLPPPAAPKGLSRGPAVLLRGARVAPRGVVLSRQPTPGCLLRPPCECIPLRHRSLRTEPSRQALTDGGAAAAVAVEVVGGQDERHVAEGLRE